MNLVLRGVLHKSLKKKCMAECNYAMKGSVGSTDQREWTSILILTLVYFCMTAHLLHGHLYLTHHHPYLTSPRSLFKC